MNKDKDAKRGDKNGMSLKSRNTTFLVSTRHNHEKSPGKSNKYVAIWYAAAVVNGFQKFTFYFLAGMFTLSTDQRAHRCAK